jgi:Sulfotransferase domain
MALRVIGAGLGRTGTTSLKLALEQLLDGPCYHMLEVRERSDDPTVWADAYQGRLPEWDTFLRGYRAAVDWPSAPFWRELSEAFPDAVILLSVRDADSWWRSASSTIFPALATYFAPDAPDDGWTRMGRSMMNAFTPDWRDETAAKAAYLAHNNHVRASAPPDRLVEWSTSDGWQPICTALGLDVPTEPFPHVNTTAETRADIGLDPQ